MTSICNICKKKVSLPIRLSCNDVFCFICIKLNYVNGIVNCPTCQKVITDNFSGMSISNCGNSVMQFKNFQWIYYSFNEKWWCYDERSNIKLETIYNEYKMRGSMHRNMSEDILISTKHIITT